MLIKNQKFWTFISGFLLFLPICQATTVVVFVTRQGIVVGADQKIIVPGNAEKHLPDITKLFLIQDRFVVSSAGLNHFGVGTFMAYDFPTWIGKIEETLPPDLAVDDFASVIEKESAITFTGFDIIIGKLIKQENPFQDCQALMTYIAVGYKNSVPMVFTVDFYIDWKSNHLVGPRKILLHPAEGFKIDFGLYVFGHDRAITEWENPKSYANKELMAKCPRETEVLRNHHRDITVEQAAILIRTMVDVEKQVEPNEVGGGTTIAILPLAGNGKLINYGEGDLPPHHAGKQQKHN
jgi:hypothetical protein